MTSTFISLVNTSRAAWSWLFNGSSVAKGSFSPSFAIRTGEQANSLIFNDPVEKVGTTDGELLEETPGLEL